MWPEEGTEERDMMERDMSGPVLLDRRQVGRGAEDSIRSRRNRNEHVEWMKPVDGQSNGTKSASDEHDG